MPASMLAAGGRLLSRLIDANGIPSEHVFGDAGLDPYKLRDPRARYPVERIHAAWRLADAHIADPCWGLRAGELWDPDDLGALGYAFFAARTLREALERLVRWHRLVTEELHSVELEEADGLLTLSWSADPDEPEPLREARAALWCAMCREAGHRDGDPRVHALTLTHAPKPCDYEARFGCPARFDAERNSLTLPTKVADGYIPARTRVEVLRRDPHVAALAAVIGRDTVAERTRHVLLEALPSGGPWQKVVAQALGIRPKTLQARLQREGTTYDAVAADLRRDLAVRYLASGRYDLLEVAYLIGFNTFPAFAKAYKQWTGRSPSMDLPPA